MDAGLLKVVGQVAGIGGLALGVFLLIFRELIRKIVFPGMTKEHGYRVISMILILTFLLALAGIAAWVLVQRPAATIPQLPVATIPKFVLLPKQPWSFALKNEGAAAVNVKVNETYLTLFSKAEKVERSSDGTESASLSTTLSLLSEPLLTRVSGLDNPNEFIFIMEDMKALTTLARVFCEMFGSLSKVQHEISILLHYDDVMGGKHTRMWEVRWSHTCGFVNDKPLSFIARLPEDYEKSARKVECLRNAERMLTVDDTVSEESYRAMLKRLFQSRELIRCI